jgi:hypothetical protein
VVVGGAAGGAGVLVGAVGQDVDLPGQGGLHDAVGPGPGPGPWSGRECGTVPRERTTAGAVRTRDHLHVRAE